MVIVAINHCFPCLDDLTLELHLVVSLHIGLNLSKLDSCTKSGEGITFKLEVLSVLYSNEHKPLEVLENDIFLQRCNSVSLKVRLVCLTPEGFDQLFVLSVSLPGFHDLVETVKLHDSSGLMLSLSLVELIEPLVKEPLLPKNDELVMSDLDQLLLEIPLAQRLEALSEDADAKGAPSHSLALHEVSVLL